MVDLDPLVDAVPGTRWSIRLCDASTGAVIGDHHPDMALPAASVGKLVLLAFLAELIDDDPSIAREMIDRRRVEPVADSGIWRHLDVDRLTLADAATLVFSVSDNLATNALLDRFGRADVRAARHRYGFEATDLHDVVRDQRRVTDPPTLSRATAAELADFMIAVHRGELISPGASAWLRRGMSLGVDMSMIPHVLGLDPLHHAGPESPPGVALKTGRDRGIRADTGLLATGDVVVAYAVIVDVPAGAEDGAMAAMQAIGRSLVERYQPR